ncbi:MAG: baseplate J/gp47 family protein [Lachnospiraceae bacterium]|nr:baseplate J/gp47 family protein [Lachnospiraceae bacterium]
MKEWKSGSGTWEDVVKRIADIASNYTPEWNFSIEDPDIGSALAYVYADMTEDTLKHMEQIHDKNCLAFFNSIGARQQNAACAKGTVVFRLVQGAPGGTEVDAHTGITAKGSEDEGGPVRFETEEDLYVTPAQPVCLYLTDGYHDGIYKLSDDLTKQDDPIVLFQEKGENLQKHEMYLAHDEVLDITGETWIKVSFYARKGKRVKDQLLQSLTDIQIAEFSYWTGDGFQKFSKASYEEGSLYLHKEAALPAFAKMSMEGMENYVIRCQVKDIEKTGPVSVEEIRFQSKGRNLRPQYIYGASMECSVKEFLPFGERLNLYEEVYFGSKEALTKRGAKVTFSFRLDFVKVPLETAMEEQTVEWKWIMKPSEFFMDPEYDITVEEVIWEYYNGSGWSRLFPEKEYSNIFGVSPKDHGRQKTMTFICPEDMAPVLINSCETCYIRARIVRIKNLYKMKGNYVMPLMGNPVFSYDYDQAEKLPHMIVTENNGKRCTYAGGESKKNGQIINLFTQLPIKEKALYLGFSLPPIGSPIRMLWMMEDTLIGQTGSLLWEYESSRGFSELNMADLTDHLSRSGLITFVGQEDFCKTSHFGQDMYWIRLRDEGGSYLEQNEKRSYPVLKKLWMNAVAIRHMEREVTERFTLSYFEEDCSFKLMHGNIDEMFVEVLEDNGKEENWVVWEEVLDTLLEPPGKRVYEVDRINGILRFGNGTHGRIPPTDKFEGIRVHYKCGGGSKGNIEVGKVDKLNRTVGFVSSITNPMALWGGLDAETPKEAVKRNSARLRHMDRAVTARDYEELAMEASGALQKVRCFGGKNANGEEEIGAVTLVIYPRNLKNDKNLFYAVQEEIRRHLEPRMDPGILAKRQFYITGPKLVEVEVKAEVTVGDFQDIFKVRRKASEHIRTFLDPIRGHFDGGGFEIGEFPDAMQLQNILKEIPQILWISKIYFMTFINGPKGRQEVEWEHIRRHPFVLPFCKKVEVVATVKGR